MTVFHIVQETKFNEDFARLSPDGHWTAYTSDESGRLEIYVQKSHPPAANGKCPSRAVWFLDGGATESNSS
ncbi:MAG: hypothetical protein DMG13_24670 [Acidobacteria bacterium]|nr:MAG: hypothetical protein DMG13_24670 [Acidobacteriota bacterium]